jgi:hypothetical protein
MLEVISYDTALKQAGTKKCSLLLGNGFSMPYSSYKTLLEKADLSAEDPLRVLFDRLETVDFERVVGALESASLVEAAYGNTGRSESLTADAKRVREALVNAVRATHPKHRQDIENVIPSCIEFLTQFTTVFTLNYDLLLNWVILDQAQLGDGFGLAKKIDGFLRPFKPDPRCNTYNLHGGLHLFRTVDDELEKRIAGAEGVIDAIAQTITNDNRLPLYIAEGTSKAKMKQIESVPYLRHCYSKLRESSGLFFVFGHSADDSDAHIYNALFKSNINHLYFCVHLPSAEPKEMDARLSHFKKANGSSIDYTLVDAQSVGSWGSD